MKNGKTRFLAVIDPTRSTQWALQKAVYMAKDREDVEVCALLCAWSSADCADKQEYRAEELRRHKLWLDEVIAGYEDLGVAIEPILEWNDDWREAIVETARDQDIDLVIKRASGRPNALASSDRQLIRTLKSGLLLVKHDPARNLRKVLVAVDFNTTDSNHKALNDAIMDLGKRIRGRDEAIELHCVSAYPESDKFVHAPDVARKLGISRSQAHIRRGSAAAVIPYFATEIDADLVVVGNVGRRGLSGITVGNTAEKILTDIRSDVLVIVEEDRGETAASAA